jgi:hypothetical protein
MSNPSVTATIAVDDKASPALKELANLAKMIAKETAAALNGSNANGLANSYKQATAAAKEHLSVMGSLRKEAAGFASAMAAGVASSKIYQGAKTAVKDYLPYESGTRYQTSIQSFSKADQKLLDDQRIGAAPKYGVNAMDSLKAQQAFVTRGFNAAITKAATEQAIILSKALNVPVEESAKMVEGIVFSQGIHLKDPATATAEMKRGSDLAAKAAKVGAMTPDDIKQLAIYGMAPGTAAGLSPEQIFATGMTFKRANVGGDQAGVFLRNAASHLIAPTTMGRDALSLMLARQGKTLNDFTAGSDLSPEAIDAALRQNGRGRGLGEKGIASLRESMDDEEKNVIGDRGAFNDAARKALEDSGQTFDKGEVTKIVAHMQRLRDIAQEKIRTGELYDNIVHNATQQELNAIYGPKQGGRAASLKAETYDEYKTAEEHSAGFAAKIAEDRMKGLAFAADRLSASFDALSKKTVESVQGPLEKGLNAVSTGVGALLNTTDAQKQGLVAGATVLSGAGALKMGAGAASLAGKGLGAIGAEGLAARFATGSMLAGGAARVLGPLGWGITGGELAYALTNDAAQGVTRDHTRANTARDAIRADAQERMDRELGRNPTAFEDLVSSESFDRYQPFARRRGATNEYLRNFDSSQAGDGAGWADSIRNVPQSSGFKDIAVTGTVSGTAEIHQNITVEVRPSAYLESIVKRAESVANISLNGQLGTGMHGPGDNSVKPNQGSPIAAAPTGGQ